MQSSPLRGVVAKPGLDGHARGAKAVARVLRDAGVEVTYTGLHRTPTQIVATAVQEDADSMRLPVLSGAHMTAFTEAVELLQQEDASNIVVSGGGIIPEDDVASLLEGGVAALFTPGTSMTTVVEWMMTHVGVSEESLGRVVT